MSVGPSLVPNHPEEGSRRILCGLCRVCHKESSHKLPEQAKTRPAAGAPSGGPIKKHASRRLFTTQGYDLCGQGSQGLAPGRAWAWPRVYACGPPSIGVECLGER